MLIDRSEVNVGSTAVWDRLYTHLALLTSRGAVSAEELADVFAPLLITCDSQHLNQVQSFLC